MWVRHWPCRRRTGYRGASSGSVERMAWQAVAVMARRIIGSKFFEERLTIATSLGHSSPWSKRGLGITALEPLRRR
jgi:hypothetical protein